MLVSVRLASHCCRSLAVRGFAAEADAEDAIVAMVGDQYKAAVDEKNRRHRTVTPWFADGALSVQAETPATVANLNPEPREQRLRKVKIYKDGAHPMTSASADTHAWRMTWERQGMWHNTAMGWNSGVDPKAGIKLKFDELEDATGFAERQGWDYEVDEPQLRRSFDGEKRYDYNFLAEHVQHKLEEAKQAGDVGRVTQSEFKHTAGKSAWQNLGYTKRGHEIHNIDIDSDTDKKDGSKTFKR